jgi:hypothetical protein
MAASATNTSREMGAVFGVAVLGSLVNSKLTGQLAARLKAIGVPPTFQSLVLRYITGGSGASGAVSSDEKKYGPIVNKVIDAAYDAFGSGLHLALDISGILLLCGAIVAAAAVRREPSELYDV